MQKASDIMQKIACEWSFETS